MKCVQIQIYSNFSKTCLLHYCANKIVLNISNKLKIANIVLYSVHYTVYM